MENRDSKGRFTKGNPGGGRPKKQPTTRDWLKSIEQNIAPIAINHLLDLMYSDDEEISLKANIAILDLCLKYASDDTNPTHVGISEIIEGL